MAAVGRAPSSHDEGVCVLALVWSPVAVLILHLFQAPRQNVVARVSRATVVIGMKT